MSTTTKLGDFTWIHFQNPKEKEIRDALGHLKIHHLILEELFSPSDRGKVENLGNYLFMVYHLPIYNAEERTSRRAEIDVIATKKLVITVAYEHVEPLIQFEHDLPKKYAHKITHTAQFIYYLFGEVNEFSLRHLRHIEEKVGVVGKELFNHPDRELLEEISYINRDILDFSIISAAQRTTLESLIPAAAEFWGEDIKIYFTDLLGGLLKSHYLLESLRAAIVSYSNTVSQIFQFRTSDIVRRFSVLGFLTFPLLLYTTIALQPTVEPTRFHDPLGFWTLFGVIFIIVIGLAIFFRKKGWF